jgi:hypothetical protein
MVSVRQIVTESAFGDDEVREVSSTRRDFVITGAAKNPYDWDDEATLTAAEMNEAMAARETYLATVKQRNDEYKASRGNGGGASSAPTAAPASESYNF